MELIPLFPGCADTAALQALNDEAFPPQERLTVAQLFADLNGLKRDLLGIYEAGRFAGFVSVLACGRCAYVCYFAVRAECRGRGVGSRALRLLPERYPGRQIVVDFEAPDPDAPNHAQRLRRRGFYLRNGFHATGWYQFYMETEFEIVCSDPPFDREAYEALVTRVRECAPDFSPRRYRKDGSGGTHRGGLSMIQFPKDFIWGVACASYQCEGAWDADGKGPNIWDDFTHRVGGGPVKNNDNGDVACDSYHRYPEDIALMKQHNIRAYRFSISWARVMPDGDGAVNEAGLAYYDDLVDRLLAEGIEPMITLYHWDLPSALQYRGGWLNREIVDIFARYADVVARRFKGRVKKYMTINEPQCIALGYTTEVMAPGWRCPDEDIARLYHHVALAHSAAQRAIKAVDPETVVGLVPCGRLCFPQQDTPENREAAYRATFDLSQGWQGCHNIVLDSVILRRYDDSAPAAVKKFAATVPESDWAAMEAPDFIGINVYNGNRVDDAGRDLPLFRGFPRTACKWPVTPEVMHYGPLNLYRRYGLPVMITENGLSCNDMIFRDGQVHDPKRIDFLHRYLAELSKAIAEGAPVLGYLQWSFLDNFEWASGYDERFGIIYVDYPTLRRIPKDSARWYAKVIETNGACLND